MSSPEPKFKHLSWDRVASTAFFAMITLIAAYIGSTLRDLNTNIAQLNIQMASVVVQLGESAKESVELKVKVENNSKMIIDHEGRIKVLESR